MVELRIKVRGEWYEPCLECGSNPCEDCDLYHPTAPCIGKLIKGIRGRLYFNENLFDFCMKYKCVFKKVNDDGKV